MTNKANSYNIEFIKREVIHISLIIASVLGTSAFLITNAFRYYNNSFTISLLFESLILAVLLTITLRRKHINVSTKAYIMIALLLILSLTDAYIFGLLSATRIYLVLVPLFAIIYFPFKRSLMIYLPGITAFVIIGYLHSTGVLQIPAGYSPPVYLARFSPWIINALHITAGGMIILYVTHRFFKAFSDLITNLKKQNKHIAESERNYREIFNSTNEAIFIHDADDWQILDVNDVMLRMYGYESKEEVLKLSVNDISVSNHQFSEKKAREMIRKAVEEGPQIFNWLSKKKNGDIFHSEISLNSSMIGGQGRVMAVLRDVSERRKSEHALKESETRYQTIFEAFSEIILILDLKGKIIFANKALEEITGITPADYSNPFMDANIHPDDKELVMDEINKLLSGKETHSPIIENRFVDTKGNTLWFSGTISKVYLNNQLHLQIITRDITDKKHAEEQLEKYRNHLEHLVQERTEELEATNEELIVANDELINHREELEATLHKLQKTQKQLIQSEKMASLGVLAAGIAHELNNPLNFIKGGTTALTYFLEENIEQTPDIAKLVEVINEGVSRATLIVSGLNHYSRKNDQDLEESDIHKVIENCLMILHNMTNERISIEKIYTDQPFIMKCNEGKIHQALLNVLVNAVQAIEDKGTITIQTQQTEQSLHISITDTGIGISHNNIPKILDPFFTTKEPGKGTGLGLFITHSIIEEHEGKMEFESEPGKGTKIHITFSL